jgi:RNA polymerase sigma factor (sigma-70 family)
VSSAPSQRLAALVPVFPNTGDKSLNEMLPLVYRELRKIAHYHLRRQRPTQTLQTTALVHEAYLRLARNDSLPVENLNHLTSVAAQLMRWILVDHERNRRTEKRGGAALTISAEGALIAAGDDSEGAASASSIAGAQSGAAASNIDLLALDRALDKLEALDEQQSRIVELRYFGGFSLEETAESLGISTATVKRGWSSARAWLFRELTHGSADV